MSKNSKISTIIKHEYISKVKTKGFLIGTILGPLSLVLFFGIVFYVTKSMGDTSKQLHIIDKSDYNFVAELIDSDPELYKLAKDSREELEEKLLAGDIDGFVVIQPDILESGNVEVFTSGGGGIGLIKSLKGNLEDLVRNKRLLDNGTDLSVIDLVEKGINIQTKKITEDGKAEKDDTEAMAFVGYILGFVIYILVFIYGSFVSRGVIEEKTNRIVEILASSVKPFELMLGKVVGIGLVGLTQITFWLLLGFVLLTALGSFLSGDPESMKEMANMAQQQGGNQMSGIMENGELSIPGLNLGVIVAFIFYFFAGYFTYATLFAGVGAAVDNEQDAQQMQIPVTIPIIASIILVPQVMSNPDSVLSVVMSLFPLTSPIVMMVRIAATNVPVWQIAASVVLLIGNFFLALWVSGKIYRIGIMMTGKRPKFSDLIKWIKIS